MKLSRTLVLFLLATGPLAAAQRIVIPTPAPPATMAELAASSPQTATASVLTESRNVEEASPTPEASTTTLPTPALGFTGTSDPSTSVPADAGGAVGPTRILGVTNARITVHDRNGNLLIQLTPQQFWGDSLQPGSVVYQQRAAYDPDSDRWVIVGLTSTNSVKGAFLYAGAQGDPATAVWRRSRVGLDEAGQRRAELPRLAFTGTGANITYRLYNGTTSAGCEWMSLSKAALYAGGGLTIIFVTGYDDLKDVVPADSFDAGDTVTTLLEGSSLRVHSLSPLGESLTTYPDPVQFSDTAASGHQLDSSAPTDLGEPAVHYAVKRNGVLWIVRSGTLGSGATARGVVNVIRIPPGGQPVSYLIDDPAAGSSYAFPSIAVNRDGAALIAYTKYNAAIYPSAGYTFIDAKGVVAGSGTLKEGEGPYLTNRWGSYATTFVDPVDGHAFWTTQLYAKPRLVTDASTADVWATWWSYIPIPAPPKRRAAKH